MRKIEEKMLDSIYNQKNMCQNNTVVSWDKGICNIYLWGNKIISYDPQNKKAVLSSCDWHTNTTKSRLNAFLGGLSNYKYGIKQNNFDWFLIKSRWDEPYNEEIFFDGIEVKI